MASRRNLKKDISYVIGDIFTECLIYKELVPGTDRDEADRLMIDLLAIDNEFTSRISHTEPGAARKYYRAFYKDFNDRIQEVIAKMVKLKK